jgi:hypothetical protein
MSKSRDPVNYVLIGSRYQVVNEKGDLLPEWGVGVFRSGIQLDLAAKLYVELVAGQVGSSWDGESKRVARELAAAAFSLSEVFLDEVDKHLRRPPPEDNNDSRR